jgi:hypothetical protein
MCFVRSQIDVLVVEDFIIERAGIPALWDLQANEKPAGGGEAVGHLVYTLL